VGVVDKAVQDGVCISWIAKHRALPLTLSG
jgi:hypothetical protein